MHLNSEVGNDSDVGHYVNLNLCRYMPKPKTDPKTMERKKIRKLFSASMKVLGKYLFQMMKWWRRRSQYLSFHYALAYDIQHIRKKFCRKKRAANVTKHHKCIHFVHSSTHTKRSWSSEVRAAFVRAARLLFS